MVAAAGFLLHPDRQFFYFAFVIARLTLYLASQFSFYGFKLCSDQNIYSEFFSDGCSDEIIRRGNDDAGVPAYLTGLNQCPRFRRIMGLIAFCIKASCR